MHRIIHFLLLILAVTPALSQIQTDSESEHILSYHSDIRIDSTREVYVTETITVYAGGNNIKRGIFRQIPLSYLYKGGNVHVGFELLGVKKDGEPEPYHTKWMDNGIAIYAGQEDVMLEPGIYQYEFSYKVYHVLGIFKDWDELYWNINGNGWDFNIDTLSATIHVPDGASVKQFTGYTGRYGEDGKDFTTKLIDGGVEYTGTRMFYRQENLTVAVGWDKGHIIYPTAWDEFMFWLESYILYVVGVLGLLIGFIANFMTWYKYGRDPKPGTIIPLFYAPKDFSPAECAYLMEEGRASDTMFGAQLMSLAVKGVVEIEYKKEGGVFKSKFYVIIRKELDQAKKELNDIELAFYKKLFGSKDIITIKKKKYNPRVKSAYDNLISRVDAKQSSRYIVRNGHLKGRQFLFVLLTAGMGVLAYMKFGGAIPVIIVSSVLHVIMNVIFTRLYEQPTKEGRKRMDEIAGFTMYMKYADKERIRLMNPPTMNFDHFEENLPYAIALGVAREWEGQFDPVTIREGYDTRMPYLHGIAIAQISSFSDNLSSTISSAATPPSSSGSASGGGGFSGGGGGGGGGGGW